MMEAPAPLVTHRGGCHCGAVRFEVEAPADLVEWVCNCSICAMRKNTHFIVPSSLFRLSPSSSDFLSTYTFGTHKAQHKFCKVCGICSFYIPRSNPNGVAVTVHCLDKGTVKSVSICHFDGQNWEQAYESSSIADCSKEAKA
eukprot:TRINITY_DN2090_c0_g1_i2.p1 TRINITY_DN2090_c0_g1~~TRINITY_DN2090_c0_g1_i2.p1  ORF type:complete len:142 (+),score=6.15 TRINITY_DN2090_c0_g1_i2:127-552(+)